MTLSHFQGFEESVRRGLPGVDHICALGRIVMTYGPIQVVSVYTQCNKVTFLHQAWLLTEVFVQLMEE